MDLRYIDNNRIILFLLFPWNYFLHSHFRPTPLLTLIKKDILISFVSWYQFKYEIALHVILFCSVLGVEQGDPSGMFSREKHDWSQERQHCQDTKNNSEIGWWSTEKRAGVRQLPYASPILVLIPGITWLLGSEIGQRSGQRLCSCKDNSILQGENSNTEMIPW